MLKRLSIPALLVFLSVFLYSCEELNDFLNNGNLSESEVVDGLKEALRVGTDTSIAQANVTDGYFKNEAIKILFPSEAQVVYNVVKNVPGGQVALDLLVEKLNRAAEEAADKAGPIFKDAILSITINDAFNILNGTDTAATSYLRGRTESDLFTEFKPDIEDALTSVGAQQAWDQVINIYNNIPLTQPVNQDLAAYTTDKALDGLFYLVAEEEKKIRKDPLHRVTEILQRVFGN